MTYDAQKVKSGREPVYIFEIDLDSCSLAYGVGLCTASGSASASCFNTLGTCQDSLNYAKTTKTYRFASTRLDDLTGPVFPTVKSVKTSPTILTPAKGFGIRSQVTVTLQDHPWNDVDVDPYFRDRTYNPEDQGTFWGKLIARNIYTEGRTLRIKTGYLADDGTYDASNFITRTYFIDRITGPNASGQVNITGRDALRFADSEKAQVPTQSRATLTNDIDGSVTSFDITDPDGQIKASYDAGQVYIRIDDETMLLNSVTGTAPSYTLSVARSAMPSIYNGVMSSESHTADSTVQDCYQYTSEPINDIVEHLLGDVAGISASYLDTTGWQAVIASGLQNYQFSALITEPTGVKDLMEELTEHGILVWWDERKQKVKMDSMIARVPDFGPFDDSANIVADSVQYSRDDKSRISQVWLSHGLRNPVLPMDELNNFESSRLIIDQDGESTDQYGQKRIRRIWSRWLPLSSISVVDEIIQRTLAYYKVTKKHITIALDPKDDDAWTGDIINTTTRQVQDEFGAPRSLDYRVLSVDEMLKPGGVQLKYTLQSIDQDGVRYGLIGPNTLNDYDVESDANKTTYAFIVADTEVFGDGGAPYRIV